MTTKLKDNSGKQYILRSPEQPRTLWVITINETGRITSMTKAKTVKKAN